MNFSLGIVYQYNITKKYVYYSAGYGREYFDNNKRIDKREDLPELTSEDYNDYVQRQREEKNWIHVFAPNIRFQLYPLDVAM